VRGSRFLDLRSMRSFTRRLHWERWRVNPLCALARCGRHCDSSANGGIELRESEATDLQQKIVEARKLIGASVGIIFAACGALGERPQRNTTPVPKRSASVPNANPTPTKRA